MLLGVSVLDGTGVLGRLGDLTAPSSYAVMTGRNGARMRGRDDQPNDVYDRTSRLSLHSTRHGVKSPAPPKGLFIFRVNMS